MPDMKTLTVNGTTYDIVDETARNAINDINIPIDSVNGKTGKVVLNATDVGACPIITNITTAGTDLNDYKEEGEYYFSTDVTPLNIPEGVNGWLSVRPGVQADSVIKQIWYRTGTPGSNDHGTFVRTFASSVGWGEWTRYSTSKDMAFTLAELGITEFPTTMQTVSEAMSNRSVLIIDSRNILSGGDEEISDLGLSVAGIYIFMKGNSTSRVVMLCIYGAAEATKTSLQVGTYAHTNDTVIWGSFEEESPDYPGCRYFLVGGIKEWVNPPMLVGTEYRTTERHNGKPVYVKAVDFGNLPNTTEASTAHGIASIENIISCTGTLNNGSTLPYTRANHNMYCGANKSVIYVVTTSNASSYSAVITIKYTKTTD